MKEYSFNTAYTQARELYGLELNPDEFETIGLIAWDKIGNKRTKLYKYEVSPTETESGSFYVDLPCNVDIIEAVVADYEDYQRTSSTQSIANFYNGWIEDLIDDRKYNTSFNYIKGKFVKYNKEGNTLFIADNFEKIYIIYKGVIADEEGLPYLNEKELDAISAFCMLVDTRKKAAMTRDPHLWQTVPYWENTWKNLCTQARVPDYINQNEMDAILDVCVSWDRKRYGKSYKPIK